MRKLPSSDPVVRAVTVARDRRGLVTLALLTLLVALTTLACGGRDAWLDEPVPDRGPVVPPAPVADDAPRVRLQTNVGDIVVALYPEHAPISVQNFLAYVDSGFYDGTIFHRVLIDGPGMIQGGGFTRARDKKETRDPIANEADNGLSNVRGTLAMARTQIVDSATAQFYINHADNLYLDHAGDTPQTFGYAVFGVVAEGMEIVDRISLVPTVQADRMFPALPMTDIVIERATRE